MAACSQVPSAHGACSCDRDVCPKNIHVSIHSVSAAEHKGQTGQNPQEGISLDELPQGNGISHFFLSRYTVLLVLRVWIFCVNRILRLSVDLQLQLPAGAVAALIPREWSWAYSAPPTSMFCSVPQARVCGYRTKHGVQQPVWAQPSWALRGQTANRG